MNNKHTDTELEIITAQLLEGLYRNMLDHHLEDFEKDYIVYNIIQSLSSYGIERTRKRLKEKEDEECLNEDAKYASIPYTYNAPQHDWKCGYPDTIGGKEYNDR